MSIEDVTNDRQKQMIADYVSVTEEFGPFDMSTGANGAHYAPAEKNPFVAEGLACTNCELYQPVSDTEGRCAIVDGQIEPNAVCKLWVIPESKLTLRENLVKSEQRVLTADDLRNNPSLVAELRDGSDVVERRTARTTAEIRSASDNSWTLVGHAAVFDSPSQDLGGFTEVIQRGAFRRLLKQDNLDVRALFNHDQNLVLGRTPGTLTLREDPKGLVYEVNVADTTAGRDLRVLLERGDVTASSFAFRVNQDGQTWSDTPDGQLVRTITNFADLLDVSPVTYPAYESTSAMSLDTPPARASSETVEVSDVETLSSRSTEQDAGGTAEQPSDQANEQPRRADSEPKRVDPRGRRLRLRERTR